jgi:hypothetical protein
MATGAQFAIDIAAAFPEGEKLISQLDEMAAALLAAGVDADGMRDAVAMASNALADASVNTKLANEALADGSREYKSLQAAADAAAKAVTKAAAGNKGVVDVDSYRAAVAAYAEASGAVDAYGGKLSELREASNTAAATERSLAAALKNTQQATGAGLKALDERTKAIKEAEAAEEKAAATASKAMADRQADVEAEAKKEAAARKQALADAESDAKKAAAAIQQAAADSERKLKKFRMGMSGLGGPVGSLGAAGANAVDDFKDLEEAVGTTSATMLTVGATAASAAVAIAAVTAVVLAATLAMAGWAIGLADSKRNTDLATQAAEAMHPELEGLRGTIAAVSKETGAHSDELRELAGRLKEAKVAAEDMPDALRAAALAEAALGKGGSADLIAEMKAGKRAAGELAREASGKLGPIVSKQMMGISAQSQKAKDSIANLFGGLNIDSALDGLARMVSLFDANTEAGGAMKFLFESVFQPLIDQANKAAIVIEAFALGVLIGLTKLYIAVKPAIRGLADFFGFDDPATADTMAMVTTAGELLVPVILGLVTAFTAVVAIAAVVAASFALPLVAFGALVAGVVAGGIALYDAIAGNWGKIKDFLGSISLSDVGIAMMRGLAEGISGAVGLPIAAITGAAQAAISAAKNALGIHSPSKVFAELGGYTAEGFAEGVDDGAGQAQAAMTEMTAPPPQAAAPVSSGSAPAGGGSSFNFAGASFVFNGVANAEQAREMFEEMLIKFTEGVANSITGPEMAT